MKSRKFHSVLPIFFLFSLNCQEDPYIRDLPPIPFESEVQLDFRLDNSLKPTYDNTTIKKFCVGRTELDLESNCENAPILRQFPVPTQGSLLLKLAEGNYPFAKLVFVSRGGRGDYLASASVYFSDSYKVQSKQGCALKGISLEDSVSRLKYQCKGLVLRAKEKHSVVFKILDESYNDGLIFYSIFTPLPVGPILQAVEVEYKIFR